MNGFSSVPKPMSPKLRWRSFPPSAPLSSIPVKPFVFVPQWRAMEGWWVRSGCARRWGSICPPCTRRWWKWSSHTCLPTTLLFTCAPHRLSLMSLGWHARAGMSGW
eukprot:Lithocolla_globosa_v1_NODE_1116_length_2857_cov_13.628255.p3 type:complete len:106 gc:universal NODE_1116_length_2857_cov_13.628255:887-1204(+)